LPFLRRAIELDQCNSNAEKLGMYVDNHFRLLREDMVRELRDDLRVANTAQKGFRKALRVNGLELHGVQCTSDHNNIEKQVPWMVKLRATTGLPGLSNLDLKPSASSCQRIDSSSRPMPLQH